MICRGSRRVLFCQPGQHGAQLCPGQNRSGKRQPRRTIAKRQVDPFRVDSDRAPAALPLSQQNAGVMLDGAGVLVIALDTPLDPIDAADATFATDNFLAGELIGQWAAGALGDGAADAKIGMLDLAISQPWSRRTPTVGWP